MANPNPKTDHLEATKWKPGKSANPGGKTSAQRKREIRNAERATRIREKMLVALEKAMKTDPDGETVLEALQAIQSDNLRLVKDSEERGFGAPKQEMNATVATIVRNTNYEPSPDDSD